MVEDQVETRESTASSLIPDDNDSHQCQILPFMLGAIRCNSSASSPQGDFLSPHREGAIVLYHSFPGKSTLKVTDIMPARMRSSQLLFTKAGRRIYGRWVQSECLWEEKPVFINRNPDPRSPHTRNEPCDRRWSD